MTLLMGRALLRTLAVRKTSVEARKGASLPLPLKTRAVAQVEDPQAAARGTGSRKSGTPRGSWQVRTNLPYEPSPHMKMWRAPQIQEENGPTLSDGTPPQ